MYRELTKREVEQLFTGVLLRSIEEYRRACTAIERAAAPSQSEVVGYFRETLSVMEAELARRQEALPHTPGDPHDAKVAA